MRKLTIFSLVFLTLIVVSGVGWIHRHLRDRHPGYQLNLRLPEQPAAVDQIRIGIACEKITPNLADTWIDVNHNAIYEPAKGDSFIDRNQNGKFDAFWLAGFHNRRPAVGVHDDLYARAIVFDDGNLRVAWVVLDAIGLFHDDVITIRELAAAKNLNLAHVIVTCTHDHQAPDLMGLWGPKFVSRGVNADYLHFVQEQAVKAIQAADANCQPACIRVTKIDSTASDLVRDSRPPVVLDDQIHLMQFTNARTDSLLGIFINWGNHPETLADENLLVSADFCHYWLSGIEAGIFYGNEQQRPGIGGIAIFTPGAIGGLMTTMGCTVTDPWLNQKFEAASFDKARAQGYRLANLVLNALEQHPWELVEKPVLQLRAQTFWFRMQNNIFKLGALFGVIDRGLSRFRWIRSEINLLMIGHVWLLTVPGEINPEIVNGGVETPEGADFPGAAVEVPSLRELMLGKYNFVIGLTNDEVGYMMPKTHWDTKSPYTYGSKKGFYGEINSLGSEAGPTFYQAAKKIMVGQ